MASRQMKAMGPKPEEKHADKVGQLGCLQRSQCHLFQEKESETYTCKRRTASETRIHTKTKLFSLPREFLHNNYFLGTHLVWHFFRPVTWG